MSEFQEISVGFVPNRGNPRVWMVQGKHVLGVGQPFATLEELAAFRLVVKDMPAIVSAHDRSSGSFPKTQFFLETVPAETDFPLVVDDASSSRYYLKFWRKIASYEAQTTVEPTVQYAPDLNGLRPTYPYVSGQESIWTNDPETDSRWYRVRYNDEQLGSGIYKNWTVPLPISGFLPEGGYLERLFLRNATRPPLPPFSIEGIPNSTPEGWSESIPAGTAKLWEIRSVFSKQGVIQEPWIGPLEIPENEDLIRYNTNQFPDPNTIVGITTSAIAASQADTDLIAAGWTKTPTASTRYRAQRSDLGGGNYSIWNIVKVSGESGLITKDIYKLFPKTTDFSDSAFQAANRPSIDDPVTGTTAPNTGWSDTPLPNTDTLICCVSKARVYPDGSLAGPWSDIVPNAGTDAYSDVIRRPSGETFKFPTTTDKTNNTNAEPASIDLIYEVRRGSNKITSGIQYKWYRIYNNGTDTLPTEDSDGFPTSDPINVGDLTNPKLTVTPADVTGMATYRCYAIIAVGGSKDILFSQEASIQDLTDGQDVKRLILTAAKETFQYDTSTTSLVPTKVELLYFLENISATVYWYKWNGSAWVRVNHGDAGLNSKNFGISGNTLVIDTDGVFAEDGTAEEAKFAVSTNSTNPLAGTVYDIITINKLSSTGVGAPGENALSLTVKNPFQIVELDQASVTPKTGEIGATGRNVAIVKLFDGTTKKVYGVGNDYTIAVATDNADITFDYVAEGDDVKVYIDSWTANERKAICTITATYGLKTIVQSYEVTSQLDPAGATIAFVEIHPDSVNKTYGFYPETRNDIILKVRLFQNDTEITADNFDSNVQWAFNGNTSLPDITPDVRYPTSAPLTGVNRNLIRIKRSDALGNAIRVSATVTYNSTNHEVIGVNINDILSTESFVLYYSFATVPSEPIGFPAAPASGDYSTYPATGASNGWYKTWQTNSFFKCVGYEQSDGSIQWGIVERSRGEKGEIGEAADFIVRMYRYDNDSLPGNDPTSSRNAMVGGGWVYADSLSGLSGTILYEAVADFAGTDKLNLNALPEVNWIVTVKSDLTPPSSGSNGVNGWTPVPANVTRVSDGAIVQRIVDYIGGGGTKPTTGLYIGPSGLVADIENATRISGVDGQDGQDASSYSGFISQNDNATETFYKLNANSVTSFRQFPSIPTLGNQLLVNITGNIFGYKEGNDNELFKLSCYVEYRNSIGQVITGNKVLVGTLTKYADGAVSERTFFFPHTVPLTFSGVAVASVVYFIRVEALSLATMVMILSGGSTIPVVQTTINYRST